MQAVWQGVKALLKTAAVGLMIYAVVQTLVPELLTAYSMSLDSLLASAAAGVTMLLGASILVAWDWRSSTSSWCRSATASTP